MLSQANQEIRRFLDAADARRRRASETEAPIRYLDWLLGRLEAYRLQGQTLVPLPFYERLGQTPPLPAGVRPPKRWASHVSRAVEQCFRLQGQLLRLRCGDFGQDRDVPDPAQEPIRLPVAVPAMSSRERLWWAVRQRTGRTAGKALAAAPPHARRST